MTISIELESTFRKNLSTGVNIFTGAGFSVLAESELGPLPIGDMLRNELLSEFNSNLTSLQLPQLYTVLSSTHNEKLDRFIRQRFSVINFNEKYNNLSSIEIKNIFSTNVDNLIFKIYASSKNKYINNIDLYGASFSRSEAIDYFYLHGDVNNKDSDLVFRDLDIASTFSKDTSKWNYLRKKISEFPTIFWGYSMRDAGTLTSIASTMDDANKKSIWIVVNPDESQEGNIAYYKSLGFKIITSSTEDLLDYISDIYTNHIKQVDAEKVNLKEYAIPNHSEIDYREINDFYLGATPSWSDIYSPRVIKTKYYDIACNIIDKGDNVFITGGAATGKSTLLMQLASQYEFDGIKIYAKDITTEEFRRILNKSQTHDVLAFIDDCQSSLDAIALMSQNSRFRFVVAERDYAYLASSNYDFFNKNVEIIDATIIDEADAQKIYNEIPYDIRKGTYNSVAEDDSIFELIEKNCKNTKIKDRFNNIVQQLSNIDRKLVELFLLVCYMHKSRSIATIDVLMSYFHEEISNYKDVYELASALGSSLKEYSGSEITINQDAYIIRSNILADLISTRAPTKHFSSMLKKFHENVSSHCIPNYNIFKRKAYDAGLFERAFPNVNDGVEVYDTVYRKNPSAFNLQQKALYLSRSRYHKEAFRIIDEAASIAGTKNWAIKNSFAIIKFRANINNSSVDVREKLEDSLSMLEECFNSDKRKAFHAMTFADHAIQYNHKYKDDKSLSFLIKARDWLESEKVMGNKVRNVGGLLQKVKNLIYRYSN